MKLISGIVAGGILAIGVAEAQAPSSERLVEVGGTYTTEVRNSDAAVGVRSQRSAGWARAKVPVALGRGNAVVFGLSYESQLIGYRDFPTRIVDGTTLAQGDLPTRLHSVDASIGLVWRFAEPWSAAVNFAPGLHGDFGRLRSRDVVWGGNLMFVRLLGEERPGGDTSRIGVGAAFTDRFGSPLPIPLVLLDWFPSEDWFLRGTLPLDLDVGYRLSRRSSIGLGALLRGYLYRLEAAPFDGQVIRYRELQLGLFLDHGLTRRLHVQLNAGVATGQRFELRNEGNDATLVSGGFERGGAFRASLYYAL